MALGGVDIGIIKAKLEQRAAGKAIVMGLRFIATPKFMMTGRATTQRATLLIISVRKSVMVASTAIKTQVEEILRVAK